MARIVSGVEYNATDKVSPVLEKIGNTSGSVFKSMVSNTARAASSVKAVGVAFALANQSLELGRKLWGGFRAVVLDTIDASVRHRKENDKAVKTFEKMRESLDYMRAIMGDVLIPIAQATAEVLILIADATAEWTRQNRTLITLGLGDFLVSFVSGLTRGVLRAVREVSNALAGWEYTLLSAEYWIKRLVLAGVGQLKDLMYWIRRAMGVFGENEVTAKIKQTELALFDFAEATRKRMNEAARAAEDLKNKEVEAELQVRDTINNINAAAEDARARIRALSDALSESGRKANADLDKNANKWRENWNRRADETAALMNRDVELAARVEEEKARIADYYSQQRMDKAKQEAEQMKAFAAQASSTIVGVMNAAISGQKTFNEIMADLARETTMKIVQMVVEQAIASIGADAAKGAASAAAANAGIPIVGAAVAAAAAAGMFALIGAFKSDVPQGFARGGIVPGTGNRDTVPAMLTPGEVVIPAPIVRAFSGGVAAGGGGPQTANVQINLQSSAPPTNRAEYRRMVRDVIAPELRELIRTRQFVLP